MPNGLESTGQQAGAEKFLFQACQNNGVLATEITCFERGMREFLGLPQHLTKHLEGSLLCAGTK